VSGKRAPIRWNAILVGWLVAAVSGVVISHLIGGLCDLVLGVPTWDVGTGATGVVVSLVSGFLAYLLGGFTAGRISGHLGNISGVLAAVLGVIVGLGLAFDSSGTFFAWGVAIPPANFGLGRVDRLPTLFLFLVNVFGGYVGGELGEPSRPKFE
jgi:hypothetical protein